MRGAGQRIDSRGGMELGIQHTPVGVTVAATHCRPAGYRHDRPSEFLGLLASIRRQRSKRGVPALHLVSSLVSGHSSGGIHVVQTE